MTTKVPHELTEGIPSQIEYNAHVQAYDDHILVFDEHVEAFEEHEVALATQNAFGHIRIWADGANLHINTSIPLGEGEG